MNFHPICRAIFISLVISCFVCGQAYAREEVPNQLQPDTIVQYKSVQEAIQQFELMYHTKISIPATDKFPFPITQKAARIEESMKMLVICYSNQQTKEWAKIFVYPETIKLEQKKVDEVIHFKDGTIAYYRKPIHAPFYSLDFQKGNLTYRIWIKTNGMVNKESMIAISGLR